MNITYVYPEEPSVWFGSEWRCKVPYRAINRTGRHKSNLIGYRDFVQNSIKVRPVLDNSDIIVIHRNLWGPVLSAIQHWRAHDKTVIADFEEAYNLLESTDREYNFWTKGSVDHSGREVGNVTPSPITQFKWSLQLANAATVPSKRLVDDWQAFTHVELLLSYIELEKYLDILPEKHTEIILGWHGTSTHLRDFQTSGALEALNEVLSARPGVRLFIYLDDIEAVKELALPETQTIIKSWDSASSWPRPLANFDIGLSPMVRPICQRSSWAPILEYMVMKIPWVASQGPAYHDLQSFGYLVRNTADDWKNRLLDMVDHLADYKEEASGEPYLFGIGQGIDENVNRLVEIYARITEQTTGRVLNQLEAEQVL